MIDAGDGRARGRRLDADFSGETKNWTDGSASLGANPLIPEAETQ